MAGKFELYKTKAGKYRFRLRASNGQIIAENTLGALVYVNDGSQARAIEPEEIKKGTVLTERVLVVRIVHRALLVAQEQNQPGADVGSQTFPSFDVNIRGKHL